MFQPAGVGLIGAGVVGAANLITQVAVEPTSGVEQYFFQLGAVGLAIAVGFWLIRRYDDRADKAAIDAQRLLADERAAHEKTRQLLFQALTKRAE